MKEQYLNEKCCNLHKASPPIYPKNATPYCSVHSSSMFPRQSPNIYDLLIEKSYLCLTSNVNIKRAQRTQQNYSQLLFSSIADQKLFIVFYPSVCFVSC